jgi:hypothetical protein
MGSLRSVVEAKLPPRRDFRLRIPNQISTLFSQIAEVGV